jgi:YVTN family beta-propeller protein
MTSKNSCCNLGRALLTGVVALAMLTPSISFAQKSYSIQDRWIIGGEGGWDYLTVDAAMHRLYVTHGTRLEVLDTSSGKIVGSITGMKGLHGVALDNDGNFGYISDGAANSVVVFDRNTLQTIATIPAGTNPDGIVFEPVTKTVWVFNGRSHDVSVIDAAQRKVVATIALPGKPEFPQADGKGVVFDNIEDKNEIVRLDAAQKKITATWPLSNCDSPSGLAIDRAGRRLFSVCDGKKMAVTDANTGKALANPTIGDSPDAAGYDDRNELAFSSNGDGTLTVIDAKGATYPVLQNLTTQRGARTMAFDSITSRIYLVTAELGPRPAATAENPRPRPAIAPGSFVVLVVGAN